jgi:hypothetical protein
MSATAKHAKALRRLFSYSLIDALRDGKAIAP